MRGRLIRFSYLARRNRAHPLNLEQSTARKWWVYRLLDKTAAPFWFARLRRKMRHNFRNWTAFRMYCASRMFYRVEVRGVEHFKHDPSTILACGHKRDLDIPILIPALYMFKKPVSRLRNMRLMYVAARDDLFETGFLTTYVELFDRFRPLVARLSVRRVFEILQACPVKLPDEQTVNQLLHETRRLEGDLPLQEAFDEQWQKRLIGPEADCTDLTLRHAIQRAPLEVLSQYATPRIFKEPLATRIRQRHHATMIKQLYSITRILEKGGTLLVLPEGRVTPDGRFCKMRAAVIRLVLQAQVETKLLPMNVTYDFMDTIRPTATLLIGPEVEGLKRHTKLELTEIIRAKVASLSCVTLSGLASRWLVLATEQVQTQVDLVEMREEIWAEVGRLRKLGLALDCQLATRQEFEGRFERFVEYARLTGSIFKIETENSTSSDQLTLDLAALQREDCHNYTDNPVRYCYNELTELLEIWDALPETAATAKDNLSSFELGAKRVRRTAG